MSWGVKWPFWAWKLNGSSLSVDFYGWNWSICNTKKIKCMIKCLEVRYIVLITLI